MSKNFKKNQITTFIDLNSIESLGISQVIFNNSNRLKKDAFFLAKEKRSFSSATSLLILSLEELIKATIVELHSLNYPVYENKIISKIFNNHKTRHQFAGMIDTLNGLSILLRLIQIGLNRKEVFQEGKMNDEIIKNLSAGINSFCDLLNNICNDEIVKDFNNYKNNGFYVDYFDELMIPNKMINEFNFNQVDNVHQTISRIYKLIILSHHQSIKNRKNYNQFLEIRQIIKELTQKEKFDELLNSYIKN